MAPARGSGPVPVSTRIRPASPSNEIRGQETAELIARTMPVLSASIFQVIRRHVWKARRHIEVEAAVRDGITCNHQTAAIA